METLAEWALQWLHVP